MSIIKHHSATHVCDICKKKKRSKNESVSKGWGTIDLYCSKSNLQKDFILCIECMEKIKEFLKVE